MDVSIDHEPTLTEIVEYIKDNDENKFKYAFEKYQTNQRNSKKTSKKLKTLVTFAVKADRNNIVRFLIENGAHENSVLESAITCGNENIVKLVTDHGANIDEGLYFAVKTQNANMINLLIKLGANINVNQRNGNTPLQIAIVRKCDVDFIRFLIIDKRADCNVRNRNNKKAIDLLQSLLVGENDGKTKEKLQNIQDLLERHTLVDNRYPCSQGLPDGLKGYNHQMKYFTLLAVINTRNVTSEDERFELATEVDNLSPFDDIYLRKTHNGQTSSQFIQIKQTKKPYQNKIRENTFVIMLNPDKDIRKHLKDNSTIINMFMKFNEICDSALYKSLVRDFIYCTNTQFQDTSNFCFFSESLIEDSHSWSIGKQKWQIREHRFLLLEIKFVLLNVLSVSKSLDMMDERVKNNIVNQTTLINNLSVEMIENEHFADRTFWSVSKIVDEGLKAIDKHLTFLDCSEINKDNFSCRESAKDKELFLHFSNWDENMIEKRIHDFKKHFSIYTNCLSNDELNDKITAEIYEEFKYHNSMLLSVYCVHYLTRWVSEFKNGLGQFFTNENGKQLFDFLRELMTRELSQSYVESLQIMNINFKHDNERLLEFIKCTNKNILHVITEHAHLNSIKIYQTLKRRENQENSYRCNNRVFFINADFFFKYKNISNILYSFSSKINYNILFIEFPDHSREYDTFYNVFDELKYILKNNQKKKIIIVAKSDNILAVQLKLQFNQHISYSEYIGFNDLTLESQKRLLSKSVCFSEGIPYPQRKELKFKDFLNLDLASKIIDEDLLTIIISEDIVKIGNSNAFKSHVYNKEYYIPRKLLIFSIVFLGDFLKKIDKNLIFVTGITKKELISKADVREDIIHLWEDGKYFDDDILIIILSNPKKYMYETNKTTEDVFNLISNKSSKNIYWFEFRDNLFYWKMGNHKENNTFKEIFKNPIPFISPENLNKKIVLLANHPGEGKSTMLTDLAHTLRKENSDLWIVRINLKEYVYGKVSPSLDDISFSAEEISKAVEMFTLMAIQGDDKDSKIKLERKLLEIALNGSGKTRMVLLFDGFDEISAHYKEKGCILLKSLSKTNIRQLWVTTRVQMKMYLEEHLEVPACTLAPLNKEQQVQFLNKFLMWKLKNFKHSQDSPNNGKTITAILKHLEIIRKYCVNCIDGNNFSFLVLRITERRYRTLINLYKAIDHLDLSAFSETALQLFKRSIRDTEDFTKVPLNLKMLAINICRYNYDISYLETMGLFDIYYQFIEQKLEIFHEEKHTTRRDLTVVATTSFNKMHRELAVKSLFRLSCELPQLNVCNEFENINETLTRIGLVNNHANSLQFLHCSFAEFYFAEYLSTHLENINVQLEFLGNILINDDYHLIRIFFNGFLAQIKNRKSQTMNSPYRFQNLLSQKVLKEILFKENSHKEGPLHVATRCDLKQICLIILENIKDNIKIFKDFIAKRNSKGQTALHLAACNSNNDAFDIIMEYVKKYPDSLQHLVKIPDNEGQTALYLAANSNNTKMCSSILDAVVEYTSTFKYLILKTTQNGQTALHAGARRNVELCKVILESSKKHPDVLKGLMMQLDSNYKTALHTAAQSNFTEICDLLFKYFEEYPDIFKELIKYWRLFQPPLLHIASRIVNKQFCRMIVELIKEDPITIKDVITSNDKAGRTILHEATRQDNKDLFNLIITYAKEYSDYLDNTIVSHDEQNFQQNQTENVDNCKSTTVNTDKEPSNIFKYLITKPDNNGDTILHIAAHKNIKIFDTIWQTIVEYPSMLNDLIIKCNYEGQSIIHLAALEHNKHFCDTILHQIQNRPDLLEDLIMKADDKGQSALHVAVAKDDQKFCNLICDRIQNYFDILKNLLIYCDNEGQSVLHVAARRHHKYICNTLCDKIQNHPDVLKQLIMKCDNKGQNILHLATRTNNTYFCNTICDKMRCYPDLLQELLLKSNNEGQCVLYLALGQSDTILYNTFCDAVQNHPDVFKELLMKCDEEGQNVLHFIARDHRKELYNTICDKFTNHPELFERLLLKCNNTGQSVLHVAVQEHNIDFFDAICDKVKNHNGLFKELLLTCDNKGQSVLHIAAQDRSKNFYDTILTKVINDYDLFKHILLKCDNKGQSVLHVAAWKHNHNFCSAICDKVRNHPDLLKELLLKCDHYYRLSVLHVAASVHPKILFRFLSTEEDVQNVKECCDIIAENIQAHPDLLKELLMMRNFLGETALHIIATSEGFHLRFKVMLETAKKCPEIFKELITTCNNRGQTILHVVAETGDQKIAQILLTTLEEHPDVFNDLEIMSDEDGQTALSVAEENKHIEVRDMILQTSQITYV